MLSPVPCNQPLPPHLSHPSISPSLPCSTSQFLIWPLRPALWPFFPPELSLPLLLWDIQRRAGHRFLTPGYSPLCRAAALFIAHFLLLHSCSASLISYLPFNPHRHLFTVCCPGSLSYFFFISISAAVCTASAL